LDKKKRFTEICFVHEPRHVTNAKFIFGLSISNERLELVVEE